MDIDHGRCRSNVNGSTKCIFVVSKPSGMDLLAENTFIYYLPKSKNDSVSVNVMLIPLSWELTDGF